MVHISPPGTEYPSPSSDLDEWGMCPDAAPVATIATGGTLFKISAPKNPTHTAPAASRGEVRDFSRSSRKRLIDTLASINRTRVRFMPLFITLTYPAEFPTEGEVFKRHLDTFLKRLSRAYPEAAAIWKLEYQERGAPHYHLLVFGIRFIPAGWVAKTWYEVVCSGDEQHLAAGTETKRVKSWNGVMWYASKYMSKRGGEPVGVKPGRFWGIHNRKAVPIDIIKIVLGAGHFYRLRRVMFKALEKRGVRVKFKHRFQGSSIYIPAEVALEVLNYTSAGRPAMSSENGGFTW